MSTKSILYLIYGRIDMWVYRTLYYYQSASAELLQVYDYSVFVNSLCELFRVKIYCYRRYTIYNIPTTTGVLCRSRRCDEFFRMIGPIFPKIILCSTIGILYTADFRCIIVQFYSTYRTTGGHHFLVENAVFVFSLWPRRNLCRQNAFAQNLVFICFWVILE